MSSSAAITTERKLGCSGSVAGPDFFGLRGAGFGAGLLPAALADFFALVFAVAEAVVFAEPVGFLAVFFFGCDTK